MPKPEKGGAVCCWCSPPGGWSYVVAVGRSTVTVRDDWRGRRPFCRTIPREAIRAAMSPQAVAQARESGRLVPMGAAGFVLHPEPP